MSFPVIVYPPRNWISIWSDDFAATSDDDVIHLLCLEMGFWPSLISTDPVCLGGCGVEPACSDSLFVRDAWPPVAWKLCLHFQNAFSPWPNRLSAWGGFWWCWFGEGSACCAADGSVAGALPCALPEVASGGGGSDSAGDESGDAAGGAADACLEGALAEGGGGEAGEGLAGDGAEEAACGGAESAAEGAECSTEADLFPVDGVAAGGLVDEVSACGQACSECDGCADPDGASEDGQADAYGDGEGGSPFGGVVFG